MCGWQVGWFDTLRKVAFFSSTFQPPAGMWYIRDLLCIERPNSNLMMRSGFYLFHRGLRFCPYAHKLPRQSLPPCTMRLGSFRDIVWTIVIERSINETPAARARLSVVSHHPCIMRLCLGRDLVLDMLDRRHVTISLLLVCQTVHTAHPPCTVLLRCCPYFIWTIVIE